MQYRSRIYDAGVQRTPRVNGESSQAGQRGEHGIAHVQPGKTDPSADGGAPDAPVEIVVR